MKKSDLKIIEAITYGKDEHVLQVLYRRLYPKIKRYVLNNRGNHDEAMDVFQEGVIAFYQQVKADRFNTQYDIDGFIYTVSRNRWINMTYKNKRQRKLTEAEQQIPTNEHDRLEYQDMEKQLGKQLFEQLGGRCREIMEQVIFRQLSMKEVADLLGFSSRHSAKTQYHKCKKKLIDFAAKQPELMKKLLADKATQWQSNTTSIKS